MKLRNPLQNQKTPKDPLRNEIQIREELDRVYITRDGRKHLSYKNALKHLDVLSKLKI